MTSKLSWIKIEGFRSFVGPQRLDLGGPMALVLAPNSQGKTSLAEAVEFLLTGRTIRRELATSAIREFSDCLRNAHISVAAPVEVSAGVVDSAGNSHTIRRTLTQDYGANRSCQSTLFIDGLEAEDLSPVGIAMSSPPLQAPILMQHTLRYVLMAGPQERADYFKALLEVSDLETVRMKVASCRAVLDHAVSDILSKLDSLAARPELREHLGSLRRLPPKKQHTDQALLAALGAAFPPGTVLPDALSERSSLLKQQLEAKRRATFPLEGLETPQPAQPQPPSPETWKAFEDLFSARQLIDKETARLTRLFNAALATKGIGDISVSVDCPLCETPGALTGARIAAIRAQLEATKEYQGAVSTAVDSLRLVKAYPDGAEQFAHSARPAFARWPPAERSRRGFSRTAIKALLDDEHQIILDSWLARATQLKDAVASVDRSANELREASADLTLESLLRDEVSAISSKIEALKILVDAVDNAAEEYRTAESGLTRALRSVIDRRNQLVNWSELREIVDQRAELLNALVQSYAHALVNSRLDGALTEIDKAKADVFDEKFDALGEDIEYWWNLLRPGEPVAFGGVDRAGAGRRFIDLKAKLLPRSGSTEPAKLRNAVAVFSDSQLNCLGLAAFLARTSRERSGFVVLDDPVPASDEEHRGMFVARVLASLVANGTQVLLLTHDQSLWRDIQLRYQDLDLDAFQIIVHEPMNGAVVEKSSDTMLSLLIRAEPYVRSHDRAVRKIGAERLREAAERFCKELLVRQRASKGDSAATLSDYDGKNLGALRPLAEAYLTDRSHPGKLHAIANWLNRGTHDDKVPGIQELQVCLGDLKYFRNSYLR